MSNSQDSFFGWSCYSYYLAIYVLSLHVLDTNTRSSSPHWKLVVEENGRNVIIPNPSLSLMGGNIIGFSATTTTNSDNPSHQHHLGSSHNDTFSGGGRTGASNWISTTSKEDELVLQILATTVISPRGSWTKNGQEVHCSTCPGMGYSKSMQSPSGQGQHHSSEDILADNPEILDCGRPANFTYYDQLIGVANRHNHPHIPEPQVAMVFRKKGSKKDSIDLNTLERKLRKAKREKPSSIQLYNQIGNFWRIKGHTLRAIECFRKGLAVAPNNPEVLHNLARLLLTLQYLDDALFLARRSLELQAPDRSAWNQHFTLGEILKAYGHHQEAVLHFKHTLELRPDHRPAQEALHELESLLAGTGLHICTLLIIIFLVLGVLLVMLSSLENEEEERKSPPPRHFSRALAMRSLKLGISPRALRSKRLP